MTNSAENRPQVQIGDLLSPIYRDDVALVAHTLYKTSEGARANSQSEVATIADRNTTYLVLDSIYTDENYPALFLKLQDTKTFKEGWVELWYAKGEWHFAKLWKVEASVD